MLFIFSINRSGCLEGWYLSRR